MLRHLTSRRGATIATLVVSFIFLAALNAFSNVAVRGSVDFTEDGTYTLSEGTLQTLRDLKEPVTLRFFYSTKLGDTVPTYGAYANRVRSLLERYAALSRGKIKLEILNPAPYSEDEDRAVAFGVQAIPLDQSGEQVFFGLVGTNSVDESQKIPFFHPSREPFIEYDLTRLVRNLANIKKKVVGIITSLPLQGQFTPGGMQPPWPIYTEINSVFETKMLSDDVARIPDDVDVLLIAHPVGLNDKTRYAIDQYVLKGGKAIVLVDPVPESAPRRRTMFGGGMVGPGSNLPKLFKAWGIKLEGNRVATDFERALKVNAQADGRPVIAPYIAWLDLRKSSDKNNNVSHTDPVMSAVQRMILATPGIIDTEKGATTKVTPLIFTTPTASDAGGDQFRLQPDVVSLLRNYHPGKKVLDLAVRVTGKVKSAFPDGPPAPAKKEEAAKTDADKKADAKKAAETKEPAPLKESKGNIDVIVVADVDFLQDQFWSRQQDFFGHTVSVPTTNNADFLMFALDQMSGANGLKGLQGKGIASRPFTRVEALQTAAEARLRQQRADLQRRYKEIEEKLKDVRTKGKDGKIELTADQQAAVVDFTRQLLRIRREQRAVQFEARRDYDALDRNMKLIDIGLIPALVAIVALALGIVRHRRRRRRYETT